VIWHKPNPLPESVTDRPTKAHEYVFLLTKSERYWYDADAIRVKATSTQNYREPTRGMGYGIAKGANGRSPDRDGGFNAPGGLRNRRTVWTVPTEPKPFRHFAMMPSKLAEIMILAGCPAQVCAVCGAPYERVVERERVKVSDSPRYSGVSMRNDADDARFTHVSTTLGWRATCSCAAATRPGIVFDPFMGSGTTALVAQRLGRHYIGTDINAEYVRLAQTRLQYGGDDRRMIKEIGV
jgi:DNA modification methylase